VDDLFQQPEDKTGNALCQPRILRSENTPDINKPVGDFRQIFP
jgi:hypothetical protein